MLCVANRPSSVRSAHHAITTNIFVTDSALIEPPEHVRHNFSTTGLRDSSDGAAVKTVGSRAGMTSAFVTPEGISSPPASLANSDTSIYARPRYLISRAALRIAHAGFSENMYER